MIALQDTRKESFFQFQGSGNNSGQVRFGGFRLIGSPNKHVGGLADWFRVK